MNDSTPFFSQPGVQQDIANQKYNEDRLKALESRITCLESSLVVVTKALRLLANAGMDESTEALRQISKLNKVEWDENTKKYKFRES